MAASEIFERAVEIIGELKVTRCGFNDDLIWGTVMSSNGAPYSVTVSRSGGAVCGCGHQAFKAKLCKHAAAVILQIPQYDLIEWIAKGD